MYAIPVTKYKIQQPSNNAYRLFSCKQQYIFQTKKLLTSARNENDYEKKLWRAQECTPQQQRAFWLFNVFSSGLALHTFIHPHATFLSKLYRMGHNYLIVVDDEGIYGECTFQQKSVSQTALRRVETFLQCMLHS